MLLFFPQAKPDEILYSLIARYHEMSGNTMHRQTLEELFGNRGEHSSMVLPSRLGFLSEQLTRFGYSFDALLMQHTLVPYFTLFYAEETVQEVISWAKENQKGALNKLGLFGAFEAAPKSLRFCPICYAEEFKKAGEGYWHRLHQTPGVLVCERHHLPLLHTEIPFLADTGHRYISAAANHIFPAVVPQALSPKAYQQALWIASDTTFIYQNFKRIRNAFMKHHYSFRNLFLHFLQKKGLATDGGSLRIAEFRKQFCDFFSDELLQILDIPVDESVHRPWIESMCRGKSKNAHPIYYIVLSRFLCGGLPQLIDAAEEFSPKELARSPIVYGEVENFEEKRRDYRNRWLEACAQQKDACQNDIRKKAPAVYTWLNRHDKAWLRVHPQERKARGGNHSFVDWEKRDTQFAAMVPDAVNRILSVHGKPTQITITAIARQLGFGSFGDRLRKYLPRTTARMEEAVECTMDYRMRKMEWAERALTSEGELPVMWKILKKAGVRDEDWTKCWELYSRQKNVLRQRDDAG